MDKEFERLLKKSNKTIYRVSKDTGINVSTFYQWKKGTYTPKIDKLIKIAKYFGVSAEVFLREVTD